MLSAADVLWGGMSFTGCIGFLYLNGKEYRIATHYGAKLLYISEDTILLRQGDLKLKIQLLKGCAQALRAPQNGGMARLIHESVACTVRYSCSKGNRFLIDSVSDQASFESNWEESDALSQRAAEKRIQSDVTLRSDDFFRDYDKGRSRSIWYETFESEWTDLFWQINISNFKRTSVENDAGPLRTCLWLCQESGASLNQSTWRARRLFP